MVAIRVGSPGSPVKQGDPVPGQPGKRYENGQFSPSMDSIITSTFSEAKDAGVLDTSIPIFDEDGEVDPTKVEQWNPYKDISGVVVSQGVSKFSMVALVSLQNTFPGIFENSGITSILSGEDLVQQEGEKTVFGNALVTIKTNKARAAMYVYPAYYQYITIPIVPEIPGRRKGLSVSSYATLKALGHALFNKMSAEGEFELVGRFLTAGKWKKGVGGDGVRGSYLGRKNMGSYYRDANVPVATEIEKFTPVDDFADSFAQMLCHRQYLQMVCPEKAEVMQDIFDKYRIS